MVNAFYSLSLSSDSSTGNVSSWDGDASASPGLDNENLKSDYELLNELLQDDIEDDDNLEGQKQTNIQKIFDLMAKDSAKLALELFDKFKKKTASPEFSVLQERIDKTKKPEAKAIMVLNCLMKTHQELFKQIVQAIVTKETMMSALNFREDHPEHNMSRAFDVRFSESTQLDLYDYCLELQRANRQLTSQIQLEKVQAENEKKSKDIALYEKDRKIRRLTTEIQDLKRNRLPFV